jgi:predicted Rossmann fold flavoprotein
MQKVDVIVIGAGAAGLMCAIEAGKRSRKVLILDHANKPGKKILMSGGGRCNFTNYHIHPDKFISQNPHFCKSALSRYTQWDFIELVEKHKIPFHEKTLGQLFCDHKSNDILNLLLTECEQAQVEILLNATVENIGKLNDHHFKIKSTRGDFHCQSLVIATGGLSIPTMGASPFGYKVAEQFGINVWPTRAGLVPLTLQPAELEKFSILSGVPVESIVSNDKINFHENILFTHRGLSGPAILQISSYWQPGENIMINLLPKINLTKDLDLQKKQNPQKSLKMILNDHLPKRLVETFFDNVLVEKNLTEISSRDLETIANRINAWQVSPNGTEGYRTAEATLGGIDCNAISSKTFASNDIAGLYFIGEVLDVQWAWSSGWAAGQVV